MKKIEKQQADMNTVKIEHAVDVKTLQHKLQIQQNDMDNLKKTNTENIKTIVEKNINKIEKKHFGAITLMEQNTQDIVKTSENLKKLKDSIELKQDKKGHSDDIQKIKQKQSKLETKHDEDKKKQDDEKTKVTTKCTGSINELRNEVETKRTADLKKGASEMSAIRSKHNYDIQRLEKKQNADSKQLRSKYNCELIYFYVLKHIYTLCGNNYTFICPEIKYC